MNSLPKEKKRLVIVTNNLYSFGGGEKFALDVATRLKNNLSITILNTISKKDKTILSEDVLARMFDLSKINVIKLPSIGIGLKAFGTDPYVFRIPSPVSTARFIDTFSKADSIYQVSLNPLLLSYSVLFSRVMRKRFVLGVHNFSLSKSLEEKDAAKSGISRQALISLLKQIKFFHVLNDRDLKLIRTHFPKAAVRKIPNFITLPVQTVGNNSREFICLYVGRLEKNQKGIDLLCDVIEHTIAKDKEIVFHIVGKSGDGEALVAKIEKKYPKNVVWSGFLQGKKLKDAYNKASVLVFPSRYDTFSLVLLEAQSYGLPAITFDIPGPQDIIKKPFQGARVKRPIPADFSSQILRYHKLWRNKKEYLNTKKRISSFVQKSYAEQKLLPELEKFLFS
ncbi:MAG: glycosyltransferase family 4 protein [Candidatus Micrarchaeales archaeon]|jgi:glycosyltransferase involved in cell wall biosynthesis